MSTTPTSPSSPSMPLFYDNAELLLASRHANAGVKAPGNFAFARKTNAIPLIQTEFFIAQASYPIVFSVGAQREAFAVVGLWNAENLFLTDQNGWLPGHYVPAYVRRYPFILANDAQSDQYHLCVESSAIDMNGGGDQTFFTDGQPSAFARQGLEACLEFQRQYTATSAFIKALVEHDLLVEQNARIELKTEAGARVFTLDGFRVVDEERFNNLPDEVFLDWRRRGWVALVHAHLMSLMRWSTLVDLGAKRL